MATIILLEPLVFRLVLPAVALDQSSVRERIVRKFEERLQTIKQVNGYKTNIGATVTEGMLIDPDPPVIPAVNFWDGAETTLNEAGMTNRSLQMTVETYDKQTVEEGATPESLTRAARAQVTDVERAVWRDPVTLRSDPTLGGLAVGMTLIQSQPNIGLKPQTWIGSLSTYEIQYRTKAGNPYTSSDAE